MRAGGTIIAFQCCAFDVQIAFLENLEYFEATPANPELEEGELLVRCGLDWEGLKPSCTIFKNNVWEYHDFFTSWKS